MVSVRNFFSCHLLKLSITPSLLVIRGFSDIPHATCQSPLWTTGDGGRHSQIIYRSVHLSVSAPVSLPDCSGVNTSECCSVFPAVHLHPRLAACRLDRPACQSLHLMACLFARLAACFHVCLPLCRRTYLPLCLSMRLPV